VTVAYPGHLPLPNAKIFKNDRICTFSRSFAYSASTKTNFCNLNVNYFAHFLYAVPNHNLVVNIMISGT
jgi:hypothetical protein